MNLPQVEPRKIVAMVVVMVAMLLVVVMERRDKQLLCTPTRHPHTSLRR